MEPRSEMEGGGRDRSYTATLVAGNVSTVLDAISNTINGLHYTVHGP